MKKNNEIPPKEFYESDDMFNDFDLSDLRSEQTSHKDYYSGSELDIFPPDSDDLKVTLPPHKPKTSKATSILNVLSIFSIMVITGMFIYFMTTFGKFYEWKNDQFPSDRNRFVSESDEYFDPSKYKDLDISDTSFSNADISNSDYSSADTENNIDESAPDNNNDFNPVDSDENNENVATSDANIDNKDDSTIEEIADFMMSNRLSKYLNSNYERYDTGFYVSTISTTLQERMNGISYHENSNITYDDLRYLLVQYYDFNGSVQTGELVCNQKIADDLLEIFYELFQNKYQFEKIKLVDDYFADDDLSCADNNTSCFNYREMAGSTNLSKHAYGLAIDINPFYNPYVTYPDGVEKISPIGSELYADRSFINPHMIKEGDLCYNLFIEHGFTWGGNWKTLKDYQHFQKGQ